MNTCERLSESFSDYVENVLPAAERQRVETHLSVCHNCQNTIARLHQLRNQLSRLRQVRTSEDFTAVLRARIKREQRTPQAGRLMGARNSRIRTAGYAGAALMLAIFLGYLLWRPQTPIAAASNMRTYQTPGAPVAGWQADPSKFPARISYPLDKITASHPIRSARAPRGQAFAGGASADSSRTGVISTARPVRATFISSF